MPIPSNMSFSFHAIESASVVGMFFRPMNPLLASRLQSTKRIQQIGRRFSDQFSRCTSLNKNQYCPVHVFIVFSHSSNSYVLRYLHLGEYATE